jgi:hypothetical protein
MPAPYSLEKAVISEAERLFKTEDLPSVLSGLRETELWAERSGPPPRIHIAVLWASNGDMRLFSHRLEWAHDDWRDLLLEVGLANEDWQKVLQSRGIDAASW